MVICGCCPFNFDLQNLQGSYATKDKKIIVIIYPEYIIWTSSEGYKLSKKYENSPYKFLKKDYHIFKDNNRIVLQEVRLSPRLDNFYEKIGVKTLGLLYPIVGRLQVPK